jgi:hypothetical protein
MHILLIFTAFAAEVGFAYGFFFFGHVALAGTIALAIANAIERRKK